MRIDHMIAAGSICVAVVLLAALSVAAPQLAGVAGIDRAQQSDETTTKVAANKKKREKKTDTTSTEKKNRF
jgi:hypothetical protein